jgi:hypothetical protein
MDHFDSGREIVKRQGKDYIEFLGLSLRSTHLRDRNPDKLVDILIHIYKQVNLL